MISLKYDLSSETQSRHKPAVLTFAHDVLVDIIIIADATRIVNNWCQRPLPSD